jgi:N-acetylglucosamine kinase-like BadF-type ATPase
LARIANALPPPEFSQLVPRVIEVAEKGDVVAANILTDAGQELAELARIVMRRLWPGPQPLQMRMIGGVFHNSRLVRETFIHAVQAERPQAQVNTEDIDPAEGALALARKSVMTGVLQP